MKKGLSLNNSGARVAFAIDFQKLPQIDMSVFLGGGQALVSQEFLDDP